MKKESEREDFHDTMGYSTNQPAIGNKSHEMSSDQTLLVLDHRIQPDGLSETAAQKLEDAETEKKAKTGKVLQRKRHSQIHPPSFCSPPKKWKRLVKKKSVAAAQVWLRMSMLIGIEAS